MAISGTIKTSSWLGDFLNLLYPETCAACERNLIEEENVLCLQCEYNLPKTDFHLQATANPLALKFWGRIKVEYVSTFYLFGKGSRVQHLLHQLKYKGRQDIGEKTGQLYGKELKQTPEYANIDLILPIPLHPKKEKKRGYNQSDSFARGLSQTMEIPWLKDALIRNIYTKTQTKKSQEERWKNVEQIFKVNKPDLLKGKHVLLVDDVITTGSTMEACVNILLQVPDIKVSMASIACVI